MTPDTLPSPEAPDAFDRIQAVLGDLYPQYRGWFVTTLTRDLHYLHAEPRDLAEAIDEHIDKMRTGTTGTTVEDVLDGLIDTVEVPSHAVAAIVVNPADDKQKAVVLVDDILLQASTHDGPRVSMADLQAAMDGEPFFAVLPGSTTTQCIIRFTDGQVFTGRSACFARESFNWDRGKEVALKHAQEDAFAALAAVKAHQRLGDRDRAGSVGASPRRR